ncbi:MAG: hypothetical protein ACTHN5_10900 [Phycisphaerae bacterium]
MFGASLAILLVASTAQAAEKQVPLPSPAKLVAISSAGAVAASDGSDTLTLYPKLGAGDASGAITRHVGNNIKALLWKALGNKHYFLVLSASDRTLYALDDQTLDVAGKIAFPEDIVSLAAGPSPDAPDAYVALNHESPVGSNIDRVNLQSFKIDGPLENINEPYNDITSSQDGTLLYCRNTRYVPTGIRVYRMPAPDAAELKVDALLSIHNSSPEYVPDATGAYVAAGTKLHTNDWKDVADFDLPVVAFFPDRPLIVTASAQDLALYSANTYNKLATVSLTGTENEQPASPNNTAQRRGRRLPTNDSNQNTLPVLPDPAHNAIICFPQERTAAVINLADLHLPNELFLFLNLQGPRNVNVSSETTWHLQKRDPHVTFTIDSPPAGMTITPDALKWTPNGTQVGSAIVRFQLSGGGATRTQAVTLNVRRAAVDLPFAPNEFAASPDGKFAVALAYGEQNNNYNNRARKGVQSPTLAIIDPDKLTISAQRTLTMKIRALTADDNFVYVAAQDADAFYVLSAKDLSDVKRVFTKGRVNKLVAAGDRVFADGLAYVGKEFQPAPESSDPTAMYNPSNQNGRAPIPTAGGWLWHGALYDPSFKKPKLLCAAPIFFAITGTADPRAFMLNFQNPERPPVSAWGTIADRAGILRTSGQRIAQPTSQGYTLLQDIPAAATLATSQLPGDNEHPPTFKTELAIIDLVSGQPVETLPLSQITSQYGAGNNNASMYGQMSPVASAPGKIFVVAHDQVYIVKTSEIDASKLSTPLYFEPAQSALSIDVSKPGILSYKTHGGKSPIEFSFATDNPAFMIDKATGTVTIDAPKLLDKAVEIIANQYGQRYRPEPGQAQRPQSPSDILSAITRDMKAKYRELTGEAIMGIPVAVPVTVVATDAEQQTASLEHIVFLNVPEAAVLRYINDKTSKSQQMQQQQIARQQQLQQQKTQSATDTAELGALRRRVAELERQNQDLQAQNRLLREMVSGKSTIPATQP